MANTLSFFDGTLGESGYPFPSDDIDPVLKDDPEYSILWAQSILWNYFQNNCGISYNDVGRISEIRAYMRGHQPSSKYKDLILGLESRRGAPQGRTLAEIENRQFVNRDPNDKTPIISDALEGRYDWREINWEDIYTPLPRIRNRLIGLLEKTENEVSVEALDEKSAILKKKKKEGIWFDKKFKPQRDAINKGLGLPPKDEALPEDREELDLYEELGGTKLPYETAMEKALGHTFDISMHPQTARKVKGDLIDIGKAATMDRVDIDEQKVYEEYLDIADLIIEYNRREDYSKSRFGAYPFWKTLTQVKEETGMTDEELLAFAATQGGLYGNASWDETFGNKNSNGSWVFGDWKVPVLYCAWITNNQQWDVKRQTRNGEKTYRGRFGKLYDGENKKTVITSVEVVYHCYWIPNSKIVWNYGMMNDIPRDEKGCVRIPFHVYKIEGKSIGEQLIIPADDIQLSHLRYQAEIAKAPPPGFEINVDAIENLTFGNKANLSAKDWIGLYCQTGVALYKGSKAGMKPDTTPASPFKVLEGGSAIAISNFASSVNLAIQSIASITGLDPVSMANDTTRTPVKIAELGVEDMNDTLTPIYTAYVSIKESFSRNAASRIQLICMYNDDDTKGYFSVIGEEGVKAIAEAANRKAAYYGISIHDKPKNSEKQNFLGVLGEAMKPGKSGTAILKPSQYSFLVSQINSAGGLKTAMKMLAYWEAKREQKDMMTQQMNMKLNAETMAQTEQAKNKSQMDVDTHKSDLTIKEMVVQHFLDINKDKALSQQDFEQEMAIFGITAGKEAAMQQAQQEQQPAQKTP